MSKVALKLIVLKTHEIESVCQFYRTLGLEFQGERHGKGPYHFSAVVGECVLEIYPLSADKPVDTTTRIGFSVTDPDLILREIESVGGRIIRSGRETEWGYIAIVQDPDGRSVELYRV